MTHARPLALVPLLALSLCLAACAEAPAPEAKAPASPAAAPPQAFQLEAPGTSAVDREMLAIGEAEGQIDRLFPNADASRRSAGKAGPPSADRKDKAEKADEPRPAGVTGGEVDACSTACKALGSMQRSADHLCQLAGEGDGRCDDARGRVRGASARVHAACPACGTP